MDCGPGQDILINNAGLLWQGVLAQWPLLLYLMEIL